MSGGMESTSKGAVVLGDGAYETQDMRASCMHVEIGICLEQLLQALPYVGVPAQAMDIVFSQCQVSGAWRNVAESAGFRRVDHFIMDR